MRNTPLPNGWYNTNGVGVSIIDSAIRDAWQYGYLHHIRRLMVVANFMTLSGIHPHQVFAWMYEFSLDSWDWVMVFNVYSMGTWSDGGHAMRKPYVSGSNYLRKMAHMKDKEELQMWDEMFEAFVKKHAHILLHTQLANIVRRKM
jgi:deoxyribodipyrimidine photolyase-related protein